MHFTIVFLEGLPLTLAVYNWNQINPLCVYVFSNVAYFFLSVSRMPALVAQYNKYLCKKTINWFELETWDFEKPRALFIYYF